MKKNIVSISHRVIIVFGLVIIALAGFLFLTKFDAIKTSAVSPEQNLVLGKLTYSATIGTLSGGQLYVRSSNADGTGEVTLTSSIPPADFSDWSPDGTKIVYVSFGSGADIYVMNADGTNKTNLTNTQNISETNPSWSPLGKIVYERDNQIWIMNADGSGQIQFAGITQPAPTAPAWSNDGGKLAFVSGGEIWKINADGSGEQRVTTNASADTSPSWSSDGSKIVFGKGGSGISVINSDGTNETNLTNLASDINPDWSPDGTTIAFRRETNDSATGGIYLMEAGGGNQVRILADFRQSVSIFETRDNPAWQPVAQVPNTFTISGRITRTNVSLGGVTVNLSGTTNATATTDAAGNYQFSGLPTGGNYTISPSFLNHYFTPPNRSFSNLSSNQIADFTASGVCIGTACVQNGKIVFVRNGDIYTTNQDGTNLTNITNSATVDTEPNYSPDGLNIIFTTRRDGNDEIYRMNADGTNPVRLTNNSAADISPEYSYDGASIVFVSNRDGNDEIYKMNADGTNQVRLTNDSLPQNFPTFAPDGQKIVFLTSITQTVFPRQMWSMNADGTNQQQFPNPNPGASNYYNQPSYSPNGQKIIFDYGSDITTAQMWTMNADGTNRAVLTNDNGRSPSYSPDGTKIVLSNPFTPIQGIYTANSNGTGFRRISTNFDTLPDWQPILSVRRVSSDFDGDGRADISVFRPTERNWYVLRSSGGFSAQQWGFATDVLAPADYDGDLKTDIAVWRPEDGNFYVWNSFNNTFRVENFGLAGDVPTGGDFDGDGKADLAVYRSGAQGTLYYRGSMGNPQGNITAISWGVTGDKPVVGDYDGDGKSDVAVFRPSNGTWYVRKSSDGGLTAVNFGLANDKLVPADYDGDCKIDFAVFRDGIWYVQRSSQGFTAFQYGITNDVPAPADYDGDGKDDAAIFRDGIWYVLKTQTSATEITSFGLGGDKPITSAFVR